MFKTILAPALAAILAASVAYAYVASKHRATEQIVNEERALWEAERNRLAEELQAARATPPPIQIAASESVANASVSYGPSAAEVIEKLKGLRGNSRDFKSMRRIIYHLEQLVDLGPAALPAIETYLKKFEDVDYVAAPAEEEEGRGGPGNFRERGGPPGFRGGRGGARLEFNTPPSLRFGLFDVLQSIGGKESERILAEVLAVTGRPMELAYVAKTVNEMAPNAHREVAVSAAKDLLMNPPAEMGSDRGDSRDYLFYVLNLFNDASFASVAQHIIVTPEGRLDREALEYLNNTWKDQAVPAIHSAFFDARMTNQMERASLMNMALAYAGPNGQANEMLNAVISDESVRPELRAMAVFGLTRGEPTPEVIQSRLPLVEALKGSTEDPRVQRSLDATYQNLQRMLAGEPVDQNPWRAMRGGEGRGGRFGPRD